MEAARQLLAGPRPIPGTVCFHAQQCAEKALKAFLVHRGQKVPRIHDLEVLGMRCTALDPGFAALTPACDNLNEFGSPSRYPPEAPDLELSVKDAEEAVALAERIAAFVRERLPSI